MSNKSHYARHHLGVALLRVSTDRQFQEGESIEHQRRKVELVSRRHNIDLVRIFTEHFSGRKNNREVLDEIFDFLIENRDIEYVIIGDIDRFTRGGSEIYLGLKRKLRELKVTLIDATGIIQPERNRLEHLGVEYQWAIDSPSHYAEVFMAEKARAEASDILTRTIGQQIQLTRDGYQCRGANYGYQNQKITTEDGKKKTILTAHEKEAPHIIRMFELRADGGWTDPAICEAINNMGYTSRQQNIYDPKTRAVMGQTKAKLLTPKQLQRYISRPIYCGIKCEKWNNNKPIKAPIDPLVSIELFNQANRGKVKITELSNSEIKIEKNRIEYQNHRPNNDFLLRHVVYCHECHKPLVASKSRGKSGKRFGYYHCSRGHRYFGVNSREFENTIANYLKNIELKPSFIKLFREVVRDVYMEKNKSLRADKALMEDHLTNLKNRQESLLERLLSCNSALVQNRLEEQIEEVEVSINKVKDEIASKMIKEDNIEAFFQYAKNVMEHPQKSVFCANTKPQLEKIWSTIFAQAASYQNISDGTPQLTLLYRLNQRCGHDENLLAGQLSLEWNIFEAEINHFIDGSTLYLNPTGVSR